MHCQLVPELGNCGKTGRHLFEALPLCQRLTPVQARVEQLEPLLVVDAHQHPVSIVVQQCPRKRLLELVAVQHQQEERGLLLRSTPCHCVTHQQKDHSDTRQGSLSVFQTLKDKL